MKYNTTRFGEIAVPKEEEILFSEGLIGFKDKKKYTILTHRENSPLFWLQSLEDPKTAFIIMSPLLFLPHYLADVCKHIDWEIKEENFSDFSVYGIMVIDKEGEKQQILMNLLAPLVIDQKKMMGKQVIINNSTYQVAEPISPYIQQITNTFTSIKNKLNNVKK